MNNYLKGLDTLRAMASLIVVWSHIVLMTGLQLNVIQVPNAHFSVTLFFVLSGFLITFLLEKEKEKYGRISFKKFYTRRILRIWPLYYLIILISYFFISSNVSLRTFLMSIFIMPNVSLALKGYWEGSPQIWSIGVEEQFYLFWPLIIAFVPQKFKIKFFIIFIVLFTLFPFVVNFINIKTIEHQNLHSFIEKLFYATKFNCMAIGGLFGFMLVKNQKWLSVFHKTKITSLIMIVLPFFLWFASISFGKFTDEVYSVFFAIMLVVVVNGPFNIDTKTTSFLGRISYGIYMYHWIVLVLVMKFMTSYQSENYYSLIIYFLVFGITILISYLSYISFEKYFLQLKKRFDIKY